MRRKFCLLFLVLLLTIGSGFAQGVAPTVFSAKQNLAARVNDIVILNVTATDPDSSSLTFQYDVLAPHTGLVNLAFATFTGGASTSLNNSFAVPPSVSPGALIQIKLTVTDGENNASELIFGVTVSGINYAPVVTASLITAPIGSTAGNPLVSPASISFAGSISDPDGIKTYSWEWGYQRRSGNFCAGEFPQIYGASDETGWIQLGKLATAAVFDVIVTVTDGAHTATDSFTAYVDPPPGGCLGDGGGGGGGGGSTGPTSVSLSTNTTNNTVIRGRSFTATLRGTSTETLSYVLRASTTSTKATAPIVMDTSRSGCTSGCSVQKTLYAPQVGNNYYLWLDVSDSAGTVSKSVILTVQDDSGGGNGGGSGTCGERNVNITSRADNRTFKITESEKSAGLSGGDITVETIFVGGVGEVSSYFTGLTESAFIAKYGCVETLGAQIQYRFSGGNLQTAQNGATIQRTISSFPEEIQLTGLPSNFSNPTYSWQVTGAGQLVSSSGRNVTFRLTSLPSGSASATVALTVRESSDTSKTAQASVTFQLTTSLVRSAQVGYTFAGQSQQTADNLTVVGRSIDSFPEVIQLTALQSNFVSPVYSWQGTGVGTLSPASGQNSALTIASMAGESGSAFITLKVAESSDATQFVEVSIEFQLTAPAVANPPTNAAILMSAQGSVEVDTLLVLTGQAQSGIGSEFEALDFAWNVTIDGVALPVMTNRHRAVIEVPPTSTGSSRLRIEMIASEGGNAAAPVVEEVNVLLPEQHFAHFGVGSSSPTNELRVEVVIVNDSDVNADDAQLEFTSGNGEPVALKVNNEVTSNYSFSLPAGVAQGITVRSPDGSVKSGWLKLSTGIKVSAIVLFKTINSATGETINEVALFSSTLGRRFTTALRSGGNESLGIAVANPTDEYMMFDVIVTEIVAGKRVWETTVTLDLEPKSQTAKFLPEIFATRRIPSDFAGGTLAIEVPSEYAGSLIAALLRQNKDSLSTVPLAVRSE